MGVLLIEQLTLMLQYHEVYKTLAIAFILVVIIIYLFLGNLKAVIVPAVALPVSLISAAFWDFGYLIYL